MKVKAKRFLAGTVLCHLLAFHFIEEVDSRPQNNDGFELPVELIGFPVIITAVRLSNFVKKLGYALNPGTYSSNRAKREAMLNGEEFINLDDAEKRLIEKFGENVCIYRRVCLHYAKKAKNKNGQEQLDWNDILIQYKNSPERNKEFHLLSVFLGDIVGSTKLCNQLAKRRSCEVKNL